MSITRRKFIAGASAATVEAALGFPMVSGCAAASSCEAASPVKAVSANEKIVVAHIGVGGMGCGHLSWFANEADVEVAAVCDVDSNRAAKALANLKNIRPDTKAVVETDFRRVLERKDIDAITCATPDHWHALIAILAFQSGKHVYGEKPVSYDLAEAQAVLKISRRNKRVFQLGTQIHAGDNYHRAVELVRSGVLGRIHTVRCWKAGGYAVSQVPPDTDPPAGLDWDMWLGPAPKRGFNSAICPYNWRFFWDYAFGTFGDFWCHMADLPYWALDLGAPLSVKATAEEPYRNKPTTPAFMDAEFEYYGLRMTWSSRIPDFEGAAGKDHGIQFVGTNGKMVVDYETRAIYMYGKVTDDLPDVPKSIPRSPGHHRNFLDCVKSGSEPESNIVHAARMTLPMHLATISYRVGRKVEWDAAKSQFVNDEDANRLRHRPYRAPWTLPA